LRETGPFGLLILKDFTSILSMNKDAKTATLGALREVYDGSWTRHVGSDGGQELQWKGKLCVMACCTEAIDEHHAVIGAMGERFAFYRLPHLTRKTMARRAVDMTGDESKMRDEMKSAVAGLFAGLDVPARPHDLSESETSRLISLADFASKCRSAVMRDVRSEIVLVPESEYPARIAKIFRRVFSGMLAIGVDRERAWQILTKIAFDSMHKVRRQVIELFIETKGDSIPTAKIALALGLPTATTRRALEDLTAHGALIRTKIENPNGKGGNQDAWRLTNWALETLREIGKDVDAKTEPETEPEVDFGDSKSTHSPESEFNSINSPTPRKKEKPKTTSGAETDNEPNPGAVNDSEVLDGAL